MAPPVQELRLSSAAPPAVPLFDLALQDAEIAAAVDVVRGGRLGTGAVTREFEEAFATHLGCRHATAVASCTAALHLALAAVGVVPGDEVVVPSFTFVATAAAVRYCGATPVFADVTGLHAPVIDVDHAASLITPRTRAIVCVHFGGYSAPVHELRELCDREGLALVEDAAHTPSARSVRGAMLGTVGHVSCFSLFSNKVLSVGEGGLLCTDDPGIAAAAGAAAAGMNVRFDDVRAALALARLGGLEVDVAARRRLTHRYRDLLGSAGDVVTPFEDAEVDRSSCYVMPLMLTGDAAQVEVREAMARRGVQTSVLYPAVHEFTGYRSRHPDPLPRTEECARRELTVPLFPHMTDDQQDRVVAALLHATAGRAGV